MQKTRCHLTHSVCLYDYFPHSKKRTRKIHFSSIWGISCSQICVRPITHTHALCKKILRYKHLHYQYMGPILILSSDAPKWIMPTLNLLTKIFFDFLHIHESEDLTRNFLNKYSSKQQKWELKVFHFLYSTDETPVCTCCILTPYNTLWLEFGSI